MQHRVHVFGASGFVGSAVAAALQKRGAEAVPEQTPRLCDLPAQTYESLTASLTARFEPQSVVVNCAGIADAGASDSGRLRAANTIWPTVLASAVITSEAARLVQVSSAAALGDVACLDDRVRGNPRSPYAQSKAEAEASLLRLDDERIVIYRPPGVHAPQRATSRNLVRLARSPVSSVASPGNGNAPQALLANVADAIAFLALCPQAPPPVVSHPSEGVSTGELLRLLSGRDPRHLPRPLTGAVVTGCAALGRVLPKAQAISRRLDVLWHGQEQAPSWLESAGWVQPVGVSGWVEVGTAQDRG